MSYDSVSQCRYDIFGHLLLNPRKATTMTSNATPKNPMSMAPQKISSSLPGVKGWWKNKPFTTDEKLLTCSSHPEGTIVHGQRLPCKKPGNWPWPWPRIQARQEIKATKAQLMLENPCPFTIWFLLQKVTNGLNEFMPPNGAFIAFNFCCFECQIICFCNCFYCRPEQLQFVVENSKQITEELEIDCGPEILQSYTNNRFWLYLKTLIGLFARQEQATKKNLIESKGTESERLIFHPISLRKLHYRIV